MLGTLNNKKERSMNIKILTKLTKHKLVFMLSAFGISMLSALVLTNTSAFAATLTWDGSAGDNKFSTGANWSGDSAPINGDVLVFPASAPVGGSSEDRELDNDLTNLSVGGLQFTGSFASGDDNNYKIAGNELTISGDVSAEEAQYVYLLSDITLGADIAFSGMRSINFGDYTQTNKTLDIGSYNITSTAPMTVYATLVGTGNITASSMYVYGSSPNFTGLVTINGNEGYLTLGPCSGLNSSNGITMGANSALNLQCPKESTVEVPITLQGNGYTTNYDGQDNKVASMYVNVYGEISTKADVKISKIILQENASYDSYLNTSDKVTINELVANGHALTRIPGSQGILIVNGNTVESSFLVRTYGEGTTEDDLCGGRGVFSVSSMHRYVVNISTSCQSNVGEGGILAGIGKLGIVTVKAGGIIAPGLSPGTLTTGDITWEEGGIYEFEIGKDAADQIKVEGTVNLGNGTLKLLRFEGFVPPAGADYTIIDNDGTDAVTGTFKDLPEGATFSSGDDGGVYKITYKGGDGNDVVISVVTAPKVPNTGFNILNNNPIVTLLVTTTSAAAILVIAKRRTHTAK